MYYLVSFDGIGTKVDSYIQEDDNCFIVFANDDEELANAIGELAYSFDWDIEEIEHTGFFIYPLNDAFRFQITAHRFTGKRL